MATFLTSSANLTTPFLFHSFSFSHPSSGRTRQSMDSERQLRKWEEHPQARRLAGVKAQTLKQYLALCGKNDLSFLPFRYVTVALFLVWFVGEQKGRTASMATKKSHLKTSAEALGIDWLPLQDVNRLAVVEKGLRFDDTWGVNRKKPLVARLVREMIELHECSEEGLGGALVQTIYAVCHEGLLRSGEATSGLKVDDVTPLDDGVDLKIQRTKRYRCGSGQVVTIKAFESNCSGGALLKVWHRYATACPDNHLRLLFPAVVLDAKSGSIVGIDWSKPMPRSQLVLLLKKDVSRLGLDPKEYSGHSFRAGGATDLFSEPGHSIAYIMEVGRWSSYEAALVYFRSNDVAANWAAASFANRYNAL
jgi:hypothetical protein